MTCQTLPRRIDPAELPALYEQARHRAVQLRRQAFADALRFLASLPGRAWHRLGPRVQARSPRLPNLPQA